MYFPVCLLIVFGQVLGCNLSMERVDVTLIFYPYENRGAWVSGDLGLDVWYDSRPQCWFRYEYFVFAFGTVQNHGDEGWIFTDGRIGRDRGRSIDHELLLIIICLNILHLISILFMLYSRIKLIRLHPTHPSSTPSNIIPYGTYIVCWFSFIWYIFIV